MTLIDDYKYVINCVTDAKELLENEGFKVDDDLLNEIASDVVIDDGNNLLTDWIVCDYIIYVLSKDDNYTIEQCYKLFDSLEINDDYLEVFIEHFADNRMMSYEEVMVRLE